MLDFKCGLPNVSLEVNPAKLMSHEVLLRRSYYFLDEECSAPISSSVEKYLKEYSHFDGFYCAEYPIDDEFSQELSVSFQDELLISRSILSLLHVGKKNCYSPLHFDWDHGWVNHKCLTGEKTFYFFSPDNGWLLGAIGNTSSFDFGGMDDVDKEFLVAKLGGYKVVLKAGESITFPSYWWHVAEYNKTSFSISLRGELDIALRPLRVLPRNWLLQRVISCLVTTSSTSKRDKVISELLETFFDEYEEWVDRYRRMRALYLSILKSYDCSGGVHNLMSEIFSPELNMIGEEIKYLYTTSSLSKEFAPSVLNSQSSYIFEGVNYCSVGVKEKLVQYSVSKKQGLRPVRGVVAL